MCILIMSVHVHIWVSASCTGLCVCVLFLCAPCVLVWCLMCVFCSCVQYEMYSIERNAERTASAGRLLYDMWVSALHSGCLRCTRRLYDVLHSCFLMHRFVNFPEQPVVWREIAVITAALRNDSQDKHAQFLKGVCVCVSISEYYSFSNILNSFIFIFSLKIVVKFDKHQYELFSYFIML